MSKIKSIYTDQKLQAIPVEAGAMAVSLRIQDCDGRERAAICVSRTELNQLLGVVGTEKLVEALRARNEAQDLALKFEGEANEQQARAEKAEATIARVREWWNDYGHYLPRSAQAAMNAALDPKPAFVLPTEAGARFEARDNLGELSRFRTVWNGPELMFLNERTNVIWNAENVLADCADHRLLGADQ